MSNIQFTCPQCKSHHLEEVITNSPMKRRKLLIVIMDDGKGDEADIVYNEQSNEDGSVECYQCADCGFVIPCATTLSEVVEWIKQGELLLIGEIVAGKP